MKHINSRVMYVNALADVLLSSKEVNTTYHIRNYHEEVQRGGYADATWGEAKDHQDVN
jgi:hypothetical protein